MGKLQRRIDVEHATTRDGDAKIAARLGLRVRTVRRRRERRERKALIRQPYEIGVDPATGRDHGATVIIERRE